MIKKELFSQSEREESTEIMESVLNGIKKKYPEFICMIHLLKLCPVECCIPISTDFTRLFFHPQIVIKQKEKKEELEFQIMHILLHGLLGDNESVSDERQTKYLWLSQDQKVNDLCEKLGIRGTNKKRQFYMEYMRKHAPYKECFGNFYLTKHNKTVKKKAKAAQRLIASDQHFFWSQKYVKTVLGKGESDDEQDGKKIKEMIEIENSKRKWREVRCLILNNLSVEKFIYKIKAENLSGRQGHVHGSHKETYACAKGRSLEYKTLLRSYLHVAEDNRECADSIDPMLYQYGMDLYGNIPLIEPREDCEQQKIETICIAIDTSGSCSGKIACEFLRETNAIIREMSDYLRDTEIILFQCDAAIQKEERLSRETFFYSDSSLGYLEGYGGTSFIPVFDRIREIEEKEEKKINLLIYLTDGDGIYPQYVPDYPTIFVMEKQDMFTEIPQWIDRTYLEDD